jgi:hypothetical protein
VFADIVLLPPLRTSQGNWARCNVEKAHPFSTHPADVFQPHPSQNEPQDEAHLSSRAPYKLEPPIKRFQRAEVQDAISNLNPKKKSG